VAKPSEIGADDIVIARKGVAEGIDPRDPEMPAETVGSSAASAPPQTPPAQRQEVARQSRAGGMVDQAREVQPVAVTPDPSAVVPRSARSCACLSRSRSGYGPGPFNA
jgi:hypothetical protein